MGNCHRAEFVIDEDEENNKIREKIELLRYKFENKDTFLEFVEHIVPNSFLKEISHFKETFRIKKNIKCQNDLLYKINVVENTRSGRLFNVKIIKKSEISQIGTEKFKILFQNEIRALSRFKHPHVECLINVYYEKLLHDEVKIYLVTNYTSKFSLLDVINQHIENKKRFDDSEIALIMKILIETIYRFQQEKIIFKNLSPENVFFLKEDNYSTLCIKNFYFSQFTDDLTKMRGLTGPLWYMAPEMLQDSFYDQKVDVWSLGLIFYLLITLENPLTDCKSRDEVLDAIKNEKTFKKSKNLQKLGINLNAINLTFQMLVENKELRISPELIIEDRYFNDFIKNVNLSKLSIFIEYDWKEMERLKFKIKNLPVFHNIIFFIFFGLKDYFMDVEETIMLNQFFNFFDKNHDGIVKRSELEEIFESNHDIFKSENTEKFIEIYECVLENTFNYENYDKDLHSYEYFLTANVIMKMFNHRNEEKIKKKIEIIFRELDRDKSEAISLDELQYLFEIKEGIQKNYVKDALMYLMNDNAFDKKKIKKFDEISLNEFESFLFYDCIKLNKEQEEYLIPNIELEDIYKRKTNSSQFNKK